ncbi:MAG: type II secretion system F family protein [Candidatus Aenigmatarchaeota archaeon]
MLTEFSYRIFGDFAKSIRFYFIDMKNGIQRANMNYTLDEYLSLAIFTTAITFFSETVMLSFIFGFFTDAFTALLLSFTLSCGLSGIMFFLFYSYPSSVSKSRQKKIQKVLPFSVSYMTTLASSRLPPIMLFKTLSKFKDYGEIAEEANTLVRDVEMFGMTFSSAVRKRARRTPSKEFSEILYGISTVVSSGGDLALYLKEKSESLMNDYRRRIRKYAQDLSLFVEIYLTLIITGSIFFIVLSSVISTISGGLGTIAVQSFVVLALLPLISMGFIVLIKSISPTE